MHSKVGVTWGLCTVSRLAMTLLCVSEIGRGQTIV